MHRRDPRLRPCDRLTIWLRILTTRLMISRPLSGLARKAFFSKAGSIILPDYGPPARTRSVGTKDDGELR